MSDNINRYLSPVQAMMMILQDLGLDNTPEAENQELWLRWIFEAQRDMRLPVLYHTVQKEFVIDGCSIVKPKNYINLVDAQIKTPDGLYFKCITPLYKTVDTVTVRSEIHNNQKRFLAVELEETPHNFIFSDNVDGCTAVLTYRAFMLDESNLPMVDLNYIQAITAYTRFKWIVKCRMTPGLQAFSASDEEQARVSYSKLKMKNIGQDFRDSINQDVLDQVMARFWDPKMVNLNKYKIVNDRRNLLNVYRGVITSTRFRRGF